MRPEENVLGQLPDLLTLRRRQPRRSLRAELRVLLLQSGLVRERGFPLPLQLAGHQPVLRLHQAVLSLPQQLKRRMPPGYRVMTIA